MSENDDEVPVKRPSMKKPAAAKAGQGQHKSLDSTKGKSKAVKNAAIKKKPSCKLSTDGKNGGDRGAAPTEEPPSSADERQCEGTKDDAEKADEQGNDGATIKNNVTLEANEKVAQTESTSGLNKGGVKPRPGFRGCSKCRWKGSTCCQI